MRMRRMGRGERIRERFNNQSAFLEENRNKPKNPETKMLLAFSVIRFLNFIHSIFFSGKKNKRNSFRKGSSWGAEKIVT